MGRSVDIIKLLLHCISSLL